MHILPTEDMHGNRNWRAQTLESLRGSVEVMKP